jgi:aspartyl-tRNA(Asn)/glutamyl-tRNA(Gln) amidotransferase subunit B
MSRTNTSWRPIIMIVPRKTSGCKDMSMQWEIVIGLEVHTQLSTSSKIFSGASTTYGAEPNTQADAVSIALPGVLPVLNKGAVERAIKFGLAIGAHIAPRSVFARKNYFYPDLPKGYQISQFDLPVVGQGALTIQVEPLSGNASTSSGQAYEKVVRIIRAHLEEDAGKSIHGRALSSVADLAVAGLAVVDNPLVDEYRDLSKLTGVDLNRAGTPLLEIVSEPDMSSAAEAVAYAKALHSLVRWIGICDGNMQEGSFRCDVNVSVRRPGALLGTRREIKNLNSFKFMQQAIDYEAQWQIDTLESGGKIHQATVLFDADKGETHAMRSKEEAHDYRYFPDPDLLPLDITPAMLEQVRATLPELPQAKQARYINEFELTPYEARLLTASREIAEYFEAAQKHLSDLNPAMWPDVNSLDARWMYGGAIAKGIVGLLASQLNRDGIGIEQTKVTPQQFALLHCRMMGKNPVLTAKLAREVFQLLWEHPSESKDAIDIIIETKGLKQVSDSSVIEALVDEIITAYPAQVADYRSGKDKLFGFFVGLAMKASKGKANPAQLKEVLKRKLGRG